MNKLYLSDSLLCNAIDKKDDLYSLIDSGRPQIIVLSNKWINGTSTASNPMLKFGKEKGISVSHYPEDEKVLFSSLENGKYDPEALYILDINKEAAEHLRAKRILCLSQRELKTEKNVLIDDDIIYSPQKDVSGYGWKKVLGHISSLPSNNLLIFDRYLFSKTLSGVKNLSSILDAILPEGAKNDAIYNVFMIISHKKDASYDECNEKCDDIANMLKLEVHKRNYKVKIILYSVSEYCKTFYPITHNRRIIMDTGRLEATYKLDAFKFKKSLCRQSLFVEHLFSKVNLKGVGDPAYKSNYDDWESFLAFKKECEIKGWINNEENQTFVIMKSITIPSSAVR